jgi:copper chaperone NosL
MKTVLISFIFLFVLVSCGSDKPEPIKLNSDSCDFCKMTISNGKFACELFTSKGRCYKFDDIFCMIQYAKSNEKVVFNRFYVSNYLGENQLILAEKGFYLNGGNINSPMGGKIAVFVTNKEALENQTKLSAQEITWEEVYNLF